MTQRDYLKTLVVALVISVSVFAQQVTVPKRSIGFDDLAQLQLITDIQVSPDGKWVAYSLSIADMEKDRRSRSIWMASWDGSRKIKLNSGPENASQPRWSPDGRYISFVVSRADDQDKRAGSQVWLLDRDGGEAKRLTNVKGGVSEYAWSPDSTKLLLLVDDIDPDSDPEKKDGWNKKTPPPIVVDRYSFKADGGGYTKNLQTHIHIFDMAARESFALTSGAHSETSASWSPDSKSIAFVSNRTPDPDRNTETRIWVMDAVPGSPMRALTSHSGPDGGRPTWSPDGKWIAFLRGDDDKYYGYNLNKLAIVPASGGEVRELSRDLDRRIYGPLTWSPDSRTITFIVQDDMTKYLAQMPVAGGQLVKLTQGRQIIDDYSPKDGSSFAVIRGDATSPSEIMALEKGVQRPISNHNQWIREVAMGSVEDFSSRSLDGTEVHGLMIKPPGYRAGQRYPTLLWIHGGPNLQDEHTFRMERHLFSACGYVVLTINYRGSAGRGSAYQKAIYADWGNKEVQDLLGAVDEAVKMGVADPNRLGLGGWSYGGILTNYIIATDTRFQAAVSGASSSLFLSMYGTDQYIKQYERELGPPWKNKDLWIKLSYPFFQADKIKTPTLFLGGTRDFNVPIAGVEQMYQALKSLNIPTQLVLYPDQRHSLGPLSYQRDCYERYVAWFDKYLKDQQ